MTKTNSEIKQFKVTELLLNSENPRFDPVQHQTEAIEAMISDQKDKLVNMAKHIIANGLNPTDVIMVQQHGEQWLVREGNRRITALKLINQPDLVPPRFAKIKRDFQSLNVKLDNSLVESINCVIVNDEVNANEWIRLKHTGQNEGAGTVHWDAQQTSRFSAQLSNKPDGRIQLLDELRTMKSIPQEIKNNFSSIKKTNFDRLMSDPDVRKLLGIVNNNGIYSLHNGINAYLLEVLYDLAINDLSVGRIYHKADRQSYLEELKERVSQPITDSDNRIDPNAGRKYTGDGENSLNSFEIGKANDLKEQSQLTNEDTQQVKHGENYPVNRKTLIPSQHKLTIDHARILKIFNELKSIDVDTYPNAVAVTFRVFVELSADCYISKHSLHGVNSDSKLTQKIDAIATYLENVKIMTKNELRPARQMSSSQTQNSSVKTFHSYVHNKDITPVATDLKSAWDDLWIFIENVWR